MMLFALDLGFVCVSFDLDIKSYVACFIIQIKLQSYWLIILIKVFELRCFKKKIYKLVLLWT